VAPSLLAAVAAVGSGYRADAASASGGGLMQLRPATAAELGVDASVPVRAIDGAARRLTDLWTRLHDERAVVAAYRSSLRVVTDPALIPDAGSYTDSVLRLAYTDPVPAAPAAAAPSTPTAAPVARPEPEVAGTRGRRSRAPGGRVEPPGASSSF
jgi:hypothetical protein